MERLCLVTGLSKYAYRWTVYNIWIIDLENANPIFLALYHRPLPKHVPSPLHAVHDDYSPLSTLTEQHRSNHQPGEAISQPVSPQSISSPPSSMKNPITISARHDSGAAGDAARTVHAKIMWKVTCLSIPLRGSEGEVVEMR